MTKRALEDLSVELGYGGEITPEVMLTAQERIGGTGTLVASEDPDELDDEYDLDDEDDDEEEDEEEDPDDDEADDLDDLDDEEGEGEDLA